MVKKNENIEWLGVFIKLQELGYDRIYTTFSGSGDSGDIEDMSLLKLSEDKEDLEYDDREERLKDLDIEVKKELDERISDLLNNIEDWWNNEGGGGNIMINLKDKTYEIENYINITNTQDFSSSGNFLKGED
jgi:hypothetical protein